MYIVNDNLWRDTMQIKDTISIIQLKSGVDKIKFLVNKINISNDRLLESWIFSEYLKFHNQFNFIVQIEEIKFIKI